MDDSSALDFSFEIEGKIWQTAVDSTTGKMAIEVRDDDQQSYFLIFDPVQLDLSDYIQVPQADWWTTLSGYDQGYLYFDKYADPQDPTQKSIIRCHESDFTSVEEFGGIPNEHHAEKVIFPGFYSSGTEVFELCKDYLGIEIALGVEYYEQGTSIIIGYYEQLGTKFDRRLVVIRDEVELLHITQDRQLDGYASGSFMIIENLLIFITKSSQVNGVRI